MIGCPFKCIYCDQYKITQTSELDWEKIINNVKKFTIKHKNKYKEIAFFGGSFTNLSQSTMQSYFDNLTPHIDEQTYFRISTRPDAIDENILLFLKKNRVNTVELGVQSFSDIELSSSNRGYSGQTAITSCQNILEYEFALSIQLIIGLPNANDSTYSYTIEMLKKIKPNYVRLYPLLVLKDTELADIFLSGNYLPLTLNEAIKLCKLFLNSCEKENIKVIKVGLHSDIPRSDILAGPYHERFRELLYTQN